MKIGKTGYQLGAGLISVVGTRFTTLPVSQTSFSAVRKLAKWVSTQQLQGKRLNACFQLQIYIASLVQRIFLRVVLIQSVSTRRDKMSLKDLFSWASHINMTVRIPMTSEYSSRKNYLLFQTRTTLSYFLRTQECR